MIAANPLLSARALLADAPALPLTIARCPTCSSTAIHAHVEHVLECECGETLAFHGGRTMLASQCYDGCGTWVDEIDPLSADGRRRCYDDAEIYDRAAARQAREDARESWGDDDRDDGCGYASESHYGGGL